MVGGHKRPRQRHQAIGRSNPQGEAPALVDAIGAGHGGVVAQGAQGEAKIRGQQECRQQHQSENHQGKPNRPTAIQAHAQIREVQDPRRGIGEGDVRAPHQAQGDRIQPGGGEDASKQFVHPQAGVDQTGHHAGQKAKEHSHGQGKGHGDPLTDQHGRRPTPQGKGAIHGEIGKVEDPQGQIGTQGKTRIGQALVVGTKPKGKHWFILTGRKTWPQPRGSRSSKRNTWRVAGTSPWASVATTRSLSTQGPDSVRGTKVSVNRLLPPLLSAVAGSLYWLL